MDKKYCIYCGWENPAQSDICQNCGKELNPTENLLVDFLVKRTKDKVKDDAETTVFEAVKDFLLSHLYGVAMTVSFVAAASVTVSAFSAPVKAVDQRELEKFVAKNNLVGYYADNMGGIGGNPDYSEEAYLEEFGPQNNNDSGTTNTVYNSEYNSAVHDLCNEYEFHTLNYELVNANGEHIATTPEKYRLPASYSYNGVHMLSPTLPTYVEGAYQSGTRGRTEFEYDKFQREISRVLYKDGYTVGECLVETEFRKGSDNSIAAQYKYILVAVLVDGEWLVAEDYVYDVYIETVGKGEETVINGIDTYEVMDFAREYADAMHRGEDASGMWIDPDFGYETSHLLAYDPAFDYDESELEKSVDPRVETEYSNFESDLARQLADDGYVVAEMYANEQLVTKGSYDIEAERAYLVVCAFIDGQWCVVEDKYTETRR